MASVEELLRSSTLYRNLSGEDQRRLAAVSLARSYEKGETIFSEGDAPSYLVTIASGRVKVVKMIPSGKEIILEIFSPGDPVGAVVAYEGRPYPASAVAIERSECILVRRAEFFALFEGHPSLVRGFLSGMAQRIVELTRRIPEVAGGRVETRFGHLFLKLAHRMGRPRPKSAPSVKAAPVSLPPVATVPLPPPVAPAKSSNDLMRDIIKDIELPPDAPKRGDISPEDKPRKSPVMKLPDVPVVTETKDSTPKKLVASAQSSSLTEDVAKELDEELMKIKKLEVPKAAPPVEVPSKPSPQVEAKVQAVKPVDTTLKVPGMAPGSNAYLALVPQRISNAWNAPPLDLTSQAYAVVVQFRLHKNGSVTGVAIEQSSGNEYYDLAGKRAVLSANPLPMFPPDITDLYFDAHFTFTVGEPQG